MDRTRLIYLISTGLLSVMMLGGPAMYFLNHSEVSATFQRLGYPSYLVYPLAIAKLMGLLAIWTRRSETLKNLAYAGYFFDFVLAATAHLVAADGEFLPAVVALILVCVSYGSGERLAQSST